MKFKYTYIIVTTWAFQSHKAVTISVTKGKIKNKKM